MILELTKENLQICGFKEDDINDLFKQENHSCFLISDTCYYANNVESKIYTKTDGYKKYYFENGSISFPMNCPDLTNEYFDLSLAIFLKEQKRDLGTLFNKSDQYKKFISLEIEKTKLRIENQQAFIKKVGKWRFPYKEKDIAVCEAFIRYLESKPSELEKPKSAEAVIIDEYKSSISGYISTIIDFKSKDGKQNPFYYYDRIVEFHNHINKMLKDNDNVKERYDLLFSFNFHIKSCLQAIVELFIAYYNFNENEQALINDINSKMFDVDDSLNGIKNIEQNITTSISNGNYVIAIEIQNYCVPLFKEIRIQLRDLFFVELDRSPLKVKYDEVLSILENCIDFNKIQLLKDLKKDNEREPQQAEINKPKVKDYKETLWFKTGITLATGEAYNLYRKYKLDRGHFTKICKVLGFKESDRPYFSDTINNNTSNKNTFLSNDKLQKLHKHLTENNLPFGAEFLDQYNQIEAE